MKAVPHPIHRRPLLIYVLSQFWLLLLLWVTA